MKLYKLNYLLVLLFLISLFLSGCGNEQVSGAEKPIEHFIETPTKDIYVVDKANLIKEEDKQEMLKIGHELYEKTKGQVVVVTVDSLQGNNLEDVTNQIFNQFGIGDKEKNNGVLLFIALNEKKMRIETGSGVDHILTDNKCKDELNELKTYFKRKEYSEGILTVYKDLVGAVYLVDGEGEMASSLLSTEKIDSFNFDKSNPGILQALIAFFIAAILPVKILIILVTLFILYIIITNLPFFLDIFFACLSEGGSSSDSFGGGSSDGGGSSGDW